MARKIREWQPRTVIAPYWEGRHPDHYTASRLAYEGCFLAGLKRLPIEGEPFRPFKMLYAAAYDESVQPNFAVDITAQYKQRRRAILAYQSQFQPARKDRKSKVFIPLDALEERMSVMAQHYGRMIDVKYAEGFVVREIAQVEDVVALTVRSM
jgi:LmbE family N-acetylglucosaminyl deacetylase